MATQPTRYAAFLTHGLLSPPVCDASTLTEEQSDLHDNDRPANPVFVVDIVPPIRRHGHQRHAYCVRGVHAQLDRIDRPAWAAQAKGVLKESLRRKCDVLRRRDRPDKVVEHSTVLHLLYLPLSLLGILREIPVGLLTIPAVQYQIVVKSHGITHTISAARVSLDDQAHKGC